MHTERLLKLADFLDTLDENRFNLRGWVSEDFEPNKCGTVACACGWAGVIFADEGFTLNNSEGVYEPHYLGMVGWDAVQCFFGIDFLHAVEMFDVSSYILSANRPKNVANRIREVVKENV
jgi:hypothetical protein